MKFLRQILFAFAFLTAMSLAVSAQKEDPKKPPPKAPPPVIKPGEDKKRPKEETPKKPDKPVAYWKVGTFETA